MIVTTYPAQRYPQECEALGIRGIVYLFHHFWVRGPHRKPATYLSKAITNSKIQKFGSAISIWLTTDTLGKPTISRNQPATQNTLRTSLPYLFSGVTKLDDDRMATESIRDGFVIAIGETRQNDVGHRYIRGMKSSTSPSSTQLSTQTT